jgi:hypothetical protein
MSPQATFFVLLKASTKNVQAEWGQLPNPFASSSKVRENCVNKAGKMWPHGATKMPSMRQLCVRTVAPMCHQANSFSLCHSK